MESRTHMHATLSISVLGTPRLVRADSISVQLRRRPRLLLFYVAAHHEAVNAVICQPPGQTGQGRVVHASQVIVWQEWGDQGDPQSSQISAYAGRGKRV